MIREEYSGRLDPRLGWRVRWSTRRTANISEGSVPELPLYDDEDASGDDYEGIMLAQACTSLTGTARFWAATTSPVAFLDHAEAF